MRLRGLSALLAAKAAGCTTIIAVDVHESRLELAKTLGATHTINGKACDTVEAVHKICSIGVRYAVETTGSGKVLSQSLYSLRPGGTTCVIGTGSKEVTFEVEAIRGERTITGIVEGTVNPHIQIPRLVELYKNGLFPFDSFISYYDMADIHKAMEDTAKGTAIKAVIRMN
jgi:aryl-alcohol dehydrogenase